MNTTAWSTDRPQRVLDVAAAFLERDPVRHNVILTLLHGRVAHPQPGRYWVVEADGQVAGVAFQSPLDFVATITPMATEAVAAAVEAVVEQGVTLPGVSGEAATAALFAGRWTERAETGAAPDSGQRIYEVDTVIEARPTTGHLRAAAIADRDRLLAWFRDFQSAIGDPVRETNDTVDRRLAAGHLWVWDDSGPKAMAGLSEPVAAVARVGPVFTPPAFRGRGYASALVARVSRAVRARGDRCILYTDLWNPTSNSIYRSIGYRAVAEVLRYRFDVTGRT